MEFKKITINRTNLLDLDCLYKQILELSDVFKHHKHPLSDIVGFPTLTGNEGKSLSIVGGVLAWVDKYALKTTSITATGDGLIGGGTLAADRTISLDFSYLDTRYTVVDAYTKTEIDNFFIGSPSKTGYNKTHWDSVYNWQQNISGQALLGRYSNSVGPAQSITLGTGLILDVSTGVLTAIGAVSSIIAGSAITVDQSTGAVTISITDHDITYSKIQNVSASKILGRYTSTTGTVQEITIGPNLILDDTTGVLSAIVPVGDPALRSGQQYVATAGQVIFPVIGGYGLGLIDVFINGAKIALDKYTATDGINVILYTPREAGDVVELIAYRGAGTLFVSTDYVPEGSSNLYFTTARAIASVSGTSGRITYSSGVFDLATTGVTANSYGSNTAIPVLTIDSYGRITAASTVSVLIPSGALDFSGDVSGSGTTGSTTTLTLANVNSNVGSFGGSTSIPVITVNAKGLITAVSTVAISGSLTFIGDVTGSGSTGGSTTLTLTNSAVTGQALTGLNLSTGTTITSSDTILTAFGKVQNQLSALMGGVIYKGTWNASTNSPALTSSVGTQGWYYIVSAAGSTNLNGISDWKIGDWVIFDGTQWDKVDNTDAVSSVNGFTGAVSLTTADISESGGLYWTNARTIGASLTGYTSGAGTISSSDTILSAIQKLNGNISSLTTGVSSVFGRTGAVTATSGDYTTAQVTESGNLYYTDARVRAAISLSVTGLTYNSGTGAITLTSGYVIPTTTEETNWDTAYTNRITSLTTTGSSGSASLISNTLNIPTYTLGGLGGQPISTNLTSLAGLTYASASFVKMTASGTFALDTNTYITGNQTITLSGDISGSGTTAITTTIGANKVLTSHILDNNVTLAKFQQVATQTLLGRSTAATGNIEVLTLGSGLTLSGGILNTNLGSISSLRNYNGFTATAGQTTFTIPSGYVPTMIDVYFNGTKLIPVTDYTATDGSTVVLTVAAALNDKVETYDWRAAGGNYGVLRNTQSYTATASQTTFTVTNGYTVGQIDVYYNGARLTASEYTATNGTTVVLVTGAPLNTIIDIVTYGNVGNGFVSTTSQITEGSNLYFTNARAIAALAGATIAGTLGISDDVTISKANASLYLKATSSTGYNFINFYRNTSTSIGYLAAGVNSAASTNGDYMVLMNSLSTGSLVLGTNGNNVFLINSTGSIGIGSASPSTNIHHTSSTAATGGDNYGYMQVSYVGTNTTINAGYTAKNYQGTSQFMQWDAYGLRLGSRIVTNTGLGNVYFTYGNDSVGMVISGTSGNIGISGFAPAWYSGVKTLSLYSRLSLYEFQSLSPQSGLAYNAYYDGAWKYAVGASDGASAIRLMGGQIQFSLSPYGSAGSTITNMDGSDIKMYVKSTGVTIGTTAAHQTLVCSTIHVTTFEDNDNYGIQIVASDNGTTGDDLYIQNRNNTATGAYTNGVKLVTGATSWSSASDERLKTALTPIENSLSKVMSLRSLTGRYLTDSEDVSRAFLIAQDVQKVLPEAVNIDFKTGMLDIRYTEIIPLLVGALKELNQKFEDYKIIHP